jgi:hypothetical protein
MDWDIFSLIISFPDASIAWFEEVSSGARAASTVSFVQEMQGWPERRAMKSPGYGTEVDESTLCILD